MLSVAKGANIVPQHHIIYKIFSVYSYMCLFFSQYLSERLVFA